MAFLVFILWVASVIGGWVVAANRQGNGFGCLWAVILFILGPLAPVAFLLYYFIGRDNER